MFKLNKKNIEINGRCKSFSFFDFEVLPNFWLVVFYNEINGVVIVKSTDEDYRQKLMNNVLDFILVGFNSKKYDMRILNGIVSGLSPEQVFELSNCIIKDEVHIYNNYTYWNKFNFLDLIDDNPISLKEFESNKLMSIEESEVSFLEENLTDNDINDLARYCVHDVKATVKMFLDRLFSLPSASWLSMFALTSSNESAFLQTLIIHARSNLSFSFRVASKRLETYCQSLRSLKCGGITVPSLNPFSPTLVLKTIAFNPLRLIKASRVVVFPLS